jgi:2-keto-4-pentenoate hydratase/2-oxohepta-3-ene-1,7-dioic acid hydratase in catechol pathway
VGGACVRFVRYASAEGPRWGRLDGERVVGLTAAPWAGGREAGQDLARDAVRLLAPVAPSKVLCVGMNYVDHRDRDPDKLIQAILDRNLKGAPPEKDPILFLKAPSAIIGPDEPIVLPPEAERVDYEAELALVIGRRVHRPQTPEQAGAAIFGYTCANDVSARDIQERDVQWMRGKSFDSFCPVGPWIETEFEARERRLQGLLNGELRQDSSTRYQIANAATLVWFAAQAMTLEPGDLFLTGTPSGLGGLRPGDVFTVRIEGIGDLSNPVRAHGA